MIDFYLGRRVLLIFIQSYMGFGILKYKQKREDRGQAHYLTKKDMEIAIAKAKKEKKERESQMNRKIHVWFGKRS